MRKIQLPDAFKAIRIVNEAGLREEFKILAEKTTKESMTVEEIGIEMLLTVIEKVSGTKVYVYPSVAFGWIIKSS